MELFPAGKIYNFMKLRRFCAVVSVLMMVGSLGLLFFPGPNLGTDFIGGTEVEVAFQKPVTADQIRGAISGADFSSPDVIRVLDENMPNRFLIRVQEVSTVPDAQQREIEKRLCYGDQKPADCEHHASEVKFSPGGEKITVRFEGNPDLEWVEEQMQGLSGIRLRPGENNPTLQDVRDHRVEIALMNRGDQIMDLLAAKLPEGSMPEAGALRTEWIGPKAGAQLRDAAIKSILIALVFIMAYVSFRFDLRFAPGGVVALAHDSLVTVGLLVLMGRQLNLTTVAAILTIIGYSVNDTVVVYDRVRENLGKLRGSTFSRVINVSLSEMLSRTILTSGTTIMVLLCFFIWGTGALRDFALTIIIGLVFGTYSSIYLALPFTDWIDRKFFSSAKSAA